MALSAGTLLMFVRLWAIVAMQVPWRRAVGPMWWLVAAAPALALTLSLPPPAPVDEGIAAALLAEAALGAIVGLAAALPGYALLGAAATSERVFGLDRIGSRALSLVIVAVVLSTALAMNLHHPLLLAARDVFVLFPTGRPATWSTLASDGLSWLGPLVGDAAVLGLALATPALLAAAVGELVARLVSAGPEPGGVIALALAPWARVALGLIALGGAMAAYPASWTRALG